MTDISRRSIVKGSMGGDDSFTASLRKANGAVVFSQVLTPER